MEKNHFKRKFHGGHFNKGFYGRKWFRKQCVCKPVYVCRPEPVYFGCAPIYKGCFPTW